MATDFIYTRVSTKKQDTKKQVLTLLERYPGSTVIEEECSTLKSRKKLNALIERLKTGDRLIIWRLDRMVRTVHQFCVIIKTLIEKDVVFICEEQGIDLSTSAGRLMGNVLASMAQFERDLISERAKDAHNARKIKEAEIVAAGGILPIRKSPTGGRGKKRTFHSKEKVAKLFELKAKGHNWLEISALMRAHNKKWDMCKRTCYRLWFQENKDRDAGREIKYLDEA